MIQGDRISPGGDERLIHWVEVEARGRSKRVYLDTP
jgi:hypothetical protein